WVRDVGLERPTYGQGVVELRDLAFGEADVGACSPGQPGPYLADPDRQLRDHGAAAAGHAPFSLCAVLLPQHLDFLAGAGIARARGEVARGLPQSVWSAVSARVARHVGIWPDSWLRASALVARHRRSHAGSRAGLLHLSLL